MSLDFDVAVCLPLRRRRTLFDKHVVARLFDKHVVRRLFDEHVVRRLFVIGGQLPHKLIDERHPGIGQLPQKLVARGLSDIHVFRRRGHVVEGTFIVPINYPMGMQSNGGSHELVGKRLTGVKIRRR